MKSKVTFEKDYIYVIAHYEIPYVEDYVSDIVSDTFVYKFTSDEYKKFVTYANKLPVLDIDKIKTFIIEDITDKMSIPFSFDDLSSHLQIYRSSYIYEVG